MPQQFVLRDRLVEMNFLGSNTDLCRGSDLATDINGRRWVLADANDRQPRLVSKPRDLVPDLPLDRLRKGLSTQ